MQGQVVGTWIGFSFGTAVFNALVSLLRMCNLFESVKSLKVELTNKILLKCQKYEHREGYYKKVASCSVLFCTPKQLFESFNTSHFSGHSAG